MGQVFIWEAVRAGRIPRQESFMTVADSARSILKAEPAIKAALLFGSVVRGDFNKRSDVDCLAIYDTTQEERAMRVMHQIASAAHALHVPVNITPCDTVVARTRLHHLGSAFVRHLQAAIEAGGLIKGNLHALLAPTISVEKEIESYVKMKLYSIQSSYAETPSFSEEQTAKFLGKALESSVHVARKMLIYWGKLQGDSKREVQKQFRGIMPANLSRQFDITLRLDARYSEDLEQQLAGPDEKVYQAAINALLLGVPAAIRFLRSCVIRLDAARR